MRSLAWRHRGWFARRWDLVEGDLVLASLAQRGWGFRADLSVGERAYSFDVKGFFRWSLVARDEQGVEVASMKLGWRGQGVPQLAGGRRFRWDADNWWGTRWVLEDPERGARVARVHMDAFLRMDARVEVEDGAPPDAELIPVLALTWLAVVLTTQAASSAGAG